MNTIEIYVPGDPARVTSQQKGINFASRRIYTKAAVKAEAFRISVYARRYRPTQPIEGPVYVEIKVVYPFTKQLAKRHVGEIGNPNFVLLHTEKPDVDNTAKLILDVLTECGFFHDDKQVSALLLHKYYGSDPRIEISISSIIDPIE